MWYQSPPGQLCVVMVGGGGGAQGGAVCASGAPSAFENSCGRVDTWGVFFLFFLDRVVHQHTRKTATGSRANGFSLWQGRARISSRPGVLGELETAGKQPPSAGARPLAVASHAHVEAPPPRVRVGWLEVLVGEDENNNSVAQRAHHQGAQPLASSAGGEEPRASSGRLSLRPPPGRWPC